MPDYDPKSIPILDDIIEDDQEDKTVPELTESDISGIDDEQFDEQSGDYLDLFDENTTDIEAASAEPDIGAIDQFINTIQDDFDDHDDEPVESALIDYHSADVDTPAIDLQYETGQQETGQQETIQQDTVPAADDLAVNDISIENITPASGQPVVLDEIVDEIVKQLMPDLEQQLRFLVQQALEDRLPEELIEQISADKMTDII